MIVYCFRNSFDCKKHSGRADCLTFLRIPSIQERSVAVEWDTSTDKKQEKKDKLLEQNREKSRQKQIEKNQYKKQR